MIQEICSSNVSFNPIEMFFSIDLHLFKELLELWLLWGQIIDILPFRACQGKVLLHLNDLLQRSCFNESQEQNFSRSIILDCRCHHVQNVQKFVRINFEQFFNELLQILFICSLNCFLFFWDHQFSIFKANFTNVIVLVERSESSVDSVDEELSVVVLKCQDGGLQILAIMQKLIDFDPLLLLILMSLHNVISDCLSWVLPDEKNRVIPSSHQLNLVVVRFIFHHIQCPNFAFMLVITETGLLSDVPNLDDSINRSCNDLMVVDPLASHDGESLSQGPQTLPIEKTPSF